MTSAFIKRIAPAIGLLILAPWVGEFLLGNVSARLLPALPFLVPMYGGGALLIREVVRRSGRGWPTIFLLAAAYGVIEEGLVDQSLFNPGIADVDFSGATAIPALGITGYDAMAFTIGHIVWSIGIPIAIVELLTPRRRETPWLGRTGLFLTAGLYVAGCLVLFDELRRTEHFMASPAQLASVAGIALLLIGVAFAIRTGTAARDGWLPRPWQVGLGAFVAANAFVARPEDWAGVIFGVLLLGTAAMLIGWLSRRHGWGPRHRFALVAGALPTYAWLGFVLTWLVEPGDPVRWLGNAAFALIAVLLLVKTRRMVYRSAEPAAIPATGELVTPSRGQRVRYRA